MGSSLDFKDFRPSKDKVCAYSAEMHDEALTI